MKAHVPRPWKRQSFSNALHSQSWRVPRAAGTLAAPSGRGAFPVGPATGPAGPRVVSAATDSPPFVTAQPPRLPGEQFCECCKEPEQHFVIQSSPKLGTSWFSFTFRRDFGFLNLETLWDSAHFSGALHCTTAVADFLFAPLSGTQRRMLIARPLVGAAALPAHMVPVCGALDPTLGQFAARWLHGMGAWNFSLLVYGGWRHRQRLVVGSGGSAGAAS